MNPRDLSLTDLAAAYRRKDLTPTQVLDAYLDVISEGDVYRVLTTERARAQAKRAESLFARGIELGPLQGIPIALKDLLNTRGVVTAAGSKVLAEGAAAAEDAPAAARLDAAGAVFLGKTNMTELAFSGVGINPHYGTPAAVTKDSVTSDRIPGGSSSGSGVATARHWACAAIGSDTGGSVRIPASFNGLVGLKTTDGLVPIDGAVPLSTTLDTLGPMTRTVEDAWHLFRALVAEPAKPFVPELSDKLTLLAPSNVVLNTLDPEVASAFEAACNAFEAEGHEVVRQSVSAFEEILGLYKQYGSFASHESLTLYEDMMATRTADIDPRVAYRILEFRGRPSTDYIKLLYAREDIVRTFWQSYRRFDAIICPTVAILPPSISNLLVDDEAFFNANNLCLRNTMLFNFLSGPAVSVPCATSAAGLSIGLMIATAPRSEAHALGIAALVEARNKPTLKHIDG